MIIVRVRRSFREIIPAFGAANFIATVSLQWLKKCSSVSMLGDGRAIFGSPPLPAYVRRPNFRCQPGVTQIIIGLNQTS